MNPRIKNPWLPRWVQSSLSSARSSCWLGTAQQFYHDMGGEGGSRVTSKLKQGAHMHQPTVWPSPNACAQPDHEGSDSHGQLFRPYLGSSAWHTRRPVTGENPCTFCYYYYYYYYFVFWRSKGCGAMPQQREQNDPTKRKTKTKQNKN